MRIARRTIILLPYRVSIYLFIFKDHFAELKTNGRDIGHTYRAPNIEMRIIYD